MQAYHRMRQAPVVIGAGSQELKVWLKSIGTVQRPTTSGC
jgi:hypothetical protein